MFHFCSDELYALLLGIPFLRVLWLKFRARKQCRISTCEEKHVVPPPPCKTCEDKPANDAFSRWLRMVTKGNK